MDYEIIKVNGSVDGTPYTAYYLLATVHGIELKLKLRANPTEKQLLEMLLAQKKQK